MATKTNIKVSGVVEVENNVNIISKKMKRGIEKGLIKAGMLIRQESMKLAPFDLGNLRDSAFVAWAKGSTPAPSFNGHTPTLTAEYTSNHAKEVDASRNRVRRSPNVEVEVGHSVPYSLIVHEDVSWRHKIGEALFLVSAANKHQSQARILVEDELRSILR